MLFIPTFVRLSHTNLWDQDRSLSIFQDSQAYGYGSSLVAAREPSTLKMQVPWDDQQEQKEQNSVVNLNIELYRGQDWRRDPIALEEQR